MYTSLCKHLFKATFPRNQLYIFVLFILMKYILTNILQYICMSTIRVVPWKCTQHAYQQKVCQLSFLQESQPYLFFTGLYVGLLCILVYTSYLQHDFQGKINSHHINIFIAPYINTKTFFKRGLQGLYCTSTIVKTTY